jgi:predicted DCC family thiol-disulfide oxidoreductase YuxK
MAENTENKGIILFDGVCNFCNSTINLVMKHDKKNYFLFAPLQSGIGQELLKKHNINSVDTDSIILVENNKAYIKSTAALRIAKKMGRLYPLLYGMIVIPPFLRNLVYDYVAKNRYKWFGKKDSCMVPTKEMRDKFIS